MRKKLTFALAAVVLVASLAFAGLAFAKDDGAQATQAQTTQAPATPLPDTGFGPGRGMRFGMTLAPAGGAGMARRGFGVAGGRWMVQQGGSLHEYMQDALAEGLGLTPDEFAVLMGEARAKAIAAALADGAITQAQADWMLQRAPGRGAGFGNCPMHPSTIQPSQAAPQS